MGVGSKIGSLVKLPLLSLASILVAGTVVSTVANTRASWARADSLRDSPFVSERFARAHDVPLEMLSDSEIDVVALSEGVASMRSYSPLPVSRITVRSSSWHTQSFSEQFMSSFSRRTSFTIGTKIDLYAKASKNTLLHELGHVAYNANPRRTELKERWQMIQHDGYLPTGESLLHYADIMPLRHTDGKTLRRGFVDEYARIRTEEDIASTMEHILSSRFSLDNEESKNWSGWLAGSPQLSKLRLLEEYSLVPKETEAILRLQKEYRGLYVERKTVSGGQVAPRYTIRDPTAFLASSAVYLKEHPSSMWSMHVRYARAALLWESADPKEPMVRRGPAMRELKQCLASPVKDVDVYHDALNLLWYAYAVAKIPKLDILTDARAMYVHKRLLQDPMLAIDGVNPYLRKHGVLP